MDGEAILLCSGPHGNCENYKFLSGLTARNTSYFTPLFFCTLFLSQEAGIFLMALPQMEKGNCTVVHVTSEHHIDLFKNLHEWIMAIDMCHSCNFIFPDSVYLFWQKIKNEEYWLWNCISVVKKKQSPQCFYLPPSH